MIYNSGRSYSKIETIIKQNSLLHSEHKTKIKEISDSLDITKIDLQTERTRATTIDENQKEILNDIKTELKSIKEILLTNKIGD